MKNWPGGEGVLGICPQIFARADSSACNTCLPFPNWSNTNLTSRSPLRPHFFQNTFPHSSPLSFELSLHLPALSGFTSPVQLLTN